MLCAALAAVLDSDVGKSVGNGVPKGRGGKNGLKFPTESEMNFVIFD